LKLLNNSAKFWIIIVGLLSVLLSQLIADEPGDSLVWKGIYAFYNNETEQAVEILTEARQKYPLNAAVHFTWATSRWLHSQANNSIEMSHKVLNRDLDTVIPIYKSLVEKDSDKPLYKLYLGSAEGLKARIFLGNKRWFKALIPAYKGFKITKNVADNYPEIKDAQLPLGLVEYYVSLRSTLLKWAATLFGLKTSKEEGLAKIEIAAREGNFAWIEARHLLAFIYLWEAPNFNRALEHSKILANEFPKNLYFQILYIESLLKTGKTDNVLVMLKKLDDELINLTSIQISHFQSYLDYEWSLYWFLKDDIEKSLKYLERGVVNYQAELDIFLGNSYLLQGNIYDLLNKRSKAKISYKNCIELDNNSEAVNLAKVYLKVPFQK